MKIPNKRERQQRVFNHFSSNDFHDFMNLYKRFTTKLYSFLVVDTTLAPIKIHVRKNFVERL